MCPGCECVLAFLARLDYLTVVSENVSRMWVCCDISCQTGLANSAVWKCVQYVSVSWSFLPNWTGWQCFLKMCPECECVVTFPAKLDWLTVLSENVSRLWVCPGISCQTALADSALKMCSACECVLAFPAKLDWLIVLSENVSRLWVCPDISCQTGLADSALSKCVQLVSVSWDFLPNWIDWQCSLKTCPVCECALGFSAKLDWLTVLSENVSRLWVCHVISCQTGLADSAPWKCVQYVSVFWHFLPNWLTVLSENVSSLWVCPGICVLAFPAKLDWLTVLSENVSSLWVYSGIFCQTGLADSAFLKCVQLVSVSWHFLPNWTGWQCSVKMCSVCECVLAFLPNALTVHFKMCPGCECVLEFSAKCAEWQCSVKMCPGCECVPSNWTAWQGSLKMCPECECVLAFPAKLHWLTVLF